MTEPNDRAAALHACVQRWLQERIANSPVSRSVEAFNHLQAALADLEAEIAPLIETQTDKEI